MRIVDIYKKYNTPEILQTHMLRVGALAKIIVDNWEGLEIDKKSTIVAALLHDLAKPITFDLSKQASFGMSEKQIEELAKFQKKIVGKYGDDEHIALVGMLRELHCNSSIIKITSNVKWSLIPDIIKNNETEPLIVVYSDMRIAVNGIVSIKERLIDLKNRAPNEDFEKREMNGLELEKVVKENSNIDLYSIREQQLEDRFFELQEIEISS